MARWAVVIVVDVDQGRADWDEQGKGYSRFNGHQGNK
jgi:hypothetical protein